MGERRKDLIILGAIVGGSGVVALAAWLAIEAAFSGGGEPLAKTHAALCQSAASSKVHHTVPKVPGFVLRFPNSRPPARVRLKGRMKQTTRWSTRPCPGRCLLALVRGGYVYVENEEYAADGGGLVGYRYALMPRGNPNCMATPLRSSIDAEVRDAAAALAREGKRCLARVPIIEVSAPYELKRRFKLERLGLSGAVVRVISEVRRRTNGALLAEQVTFQLFATQAMLRGDGKAIACPRTVGGGPARLLRPSDVLIAPGRPVREDAER
jgi:hypothetical protein